MKGINILKIVSKIMQNPISEETHYKLETCIALIKGDVRIMRLKPIMSRKSQSAIEFISVYGFIFLIIGVVMAVLLILSGVPRLTYPSSCTVYGGFSCTDVVVSYNSVTGGASLYLRLSNSQPGAINISTFNAVIENVGSISGSCSPTFSFQGNSIDCIANVPIKTKLGKIYTGHFVISSNYCPVSSSQSVTCPASKDITFEGQFST